VANPLVCYLGILTTRKIRLRRNKRVIGVHGLSFIYYSSISQLATKMDGSLVGFSTMKQLAIDPKDPVCYDPSSLEVTRVPL
jgi:hypothetical protein